MNYKDEINEKAAIFIEEGYSLDEAYVLAQELWCDEQQALAEEYRRVEDFRNEWGR